MIKRVKGTQDFLDLRLFNYVTDSISAHLMNYHFTHIAVPIIEHTELFKRSLGTQTDVISKEMFIIAPHQHEASEESIEGSICLRPEATASMVRAFIENQVQTTPWKVFTYGPMFRYERPQKGRYRQFHQVSMEVIGSASISQDVQFIKMLDRYFHEKLHMNNYALLINFLGCPEDRAKYRAKLAKFLEAHKDALCATCLVRKETNIMRVFDCKSESCQELYKKAPFIAENLCDQCSTEWKTLQDQLHLLSVSYSYKPTLVRGLDYYSKTVFEFVSNNLGAQNTFCGGGRYDQLISQLGGTPDQPSIGAAIGIERLMLLLELQDRLALPQPPTLHVVMPMSDEQKILALLIADTLQAAGFCVEVLLDGDSIKSMMRQANKMGAAYCLLLGSEEQEQRAVTVKNMVTGTQERIAQVDLVNYLKK